MAESYIVKLSDLPEKLDSVEPTLNKIVEGDCLELMRRMPDSCVDSVITDMPYGEVNRESKGLRQLDKGIADIQFHAVSELAKQFASLANGSVYSFCGFNQISELRSTMADLGCSTRLCVWEKLNPSPMNGEKLWLSSIEACVFAKKSGGLFREFCSSAVWRALSEREPMHPTQKPLVLLSRLIRASVCDGGTVFDPFLGSGTTAVAAKKLGRNFIGCEISPEYCKIAEKRLQEIDSQPQLFEPSKDLAEQLELTHHG